MKILLTYSFDGNKFFGSQTQPNLNAAEDCLNNALLKLGITNKVVSSSRTDKGVHALRQTSTTICEDFWKDKLKKLKELINKHTNPHLHVKEIVRVRDDFQVRFDAKARMYRYILNHGEFDPLKAGYFLFCPKINITSLNKILVNFKGVHDFKNYKKTGGTNSNDIREIYESCAYRYGQLTIIKFKASGFLRSQVRLMVSNALKHFGISVFGSKGVIYKSNLYEEKPSNSLDTSIKMDSKIFENDFCPNIITKMPAPPQALYLCRVFYAQDINTKSIKK